MQKLSAIKSGRTVFRRLRILSMAAIVGIGSYVALIPIAAKAIDCSDVSGATGSARTTITVPSEGTYRLWGLLATEDASKNSLFATIDDQQCIKLGGSTLATGTSTWVGHRDGDTATKATVSVTAGTHTLTLLNADAGVKISHALLLKDTDCIPTANGENCTTAQPTTDTQKPTAPTGLRATITGNKALSLSWAASQDNVAVSGYDVYRGASAATAVKIGSTLETAWHDANLTPSTTYSYYVIARDAANNQSDQSVPISAKTLATAPAGKGKLYGQAKFAWQDADHAIISFSVNGTLRSYDSDPNGYYFITDIPAGTYLVKYAAGRSVKYADVKIKAGDTVKDITLPQAPALQPPVSTGHPFVIISLDGATLSGQATRVADMNGSSILLTPVTTPGPDPDPDPDPTPGTNCIVLPSACGYPDATNTGYRPTGVELTTNGVELNADGDLEITQAGAVIDSKLIKACVVVKAPNVTIKRSKITNCVSYFNIRLYPNATNFTIEDTEIDGNNFGGQRIALTADSEGPVTMRRVYIHNVTDGPHGGENWLVEDSFFTDFYACDICHSDGFQSAGAINVTLRHNTIHNDPPNYYDPDHPEYDGGKNAVIRIATEQGPVNGFIVENNLLAGGNFALQIREQGNGYPQGVVVRNNRIVPSWRFGPFDVGPNYIMGTVQFSGNYRDDTGAALTL